MRKLIIILLTFVQIGFVYAEGSFRLIDQEPLPDIISGKPYTTYIDFIYSGKGTPSASLIGKNLPAGLNLTVENKVNGFGSVKISGLTYAIKENPPRLITTNIVHGVKDTPYKGYMELEYSTDAPRIYISGTPVGIFTANSESRKSTEYISYPIILLITDNEGASITKDLLLKVYKGIYTVDFYGTPSRVGNYPITVLMNYDGGSYPTTFNLNIKEVDLTVTATPPIQATQKELVDLATSSKNAANKKNLQTIKEDVRINKAVEDFSTSSVKIDPTQEVTKEEKAGGLLLKIKEKIKNILINLIKNL